jgi:hypothetical protein
MAGHTFVFVKALDGSGCKTHIELFLNELVGHAVIMAFDFDVIVDVDAGFFPFGVLIGAGRQRF